jgi:two-component system, sensor histidine kinase and response regulator
MLNRKKLLIVEDDPMIRQRLLDILDSDEYYLLEASNGLEGIEMAKMHLPDLILSDIMMPILTGYDVLREIRAYPPTSLTPFLFLTAKGDAVDVRMGMNLGADDYITKPFSISEILDAVSMRLDRRNQMEEYSQEKLNAVRSNLYSALPHEFLTPLNGILGMTDVLIRHSDVLEKEEVHEMHTHILQSAKRLQAVIEKYLMYARLEGITREFVERELQHLPAHSPASIVDDIVRLRSFKYNRLHDVLQDLEDHPIAIPAENYSIAIGELIDNAFNYSQPGTPIYVELKVHNDHLSFVVQNHGRGLTPEQVNQIGAFVQFERDKYEQQGMGLGLAIAKKSAHIFNGELIIESEPNKITRVQLIVPLYDEQRLTRP